LVFARGYTANFDYADHGGRPQASPFNGGMMIDIECRIAYLDFLHRTTVDMNLRTEQS
jgi:hypothetical protein